MLLDLTTTLLDLWVGTIWLACILVGVGVGSVRGQEVTAFLVCLFFGPMGLFAVLLSDRRKQCPHCLGRLPMGKPSACTHCGRNLDWSAGHPQDAEGIAKLHAAEARASAELGEALLERTKEARRQKIAQTKPQAGQAARPQDPAFDAIVNEITSPPAAPKRPPLR